MLVGLLGILKAGAAYVPQDVGLAPAGPAAATSSAPPRTRVVLTQSRARAARSPAPDTRVITLDDADLAVPRHGRARPVPRGPYAPTTAATSCSPPAPPASPNGVKVTHRNVANLLLTEPGDLGIRPGDRVAQLLNIAFDMAAWEILGCLTHGATLVIRGEDIAATARTARRR